MFAPHSRRPLPLRALLLAGLALLARLLPASAQAQVTDPKITEWLTARSYARVYTTAANRTAGTSSTTWSGVTSPFYSDIQRVVYSNNHVYLYATGMPSYIAGNWLGPAGEQYGNWPKNRGAIHRIPRTVTIPTTKTKTNGSGGVLLNGVFVWANGDAQSYDNTGSPNAATGTIASTGDGIWNRLAGVAEDFNFDPAKGHHPPNGAYHNHVNPLGLRHQLGDHVAYDSSTKRYSEITATAPTAHSPLLGFANDGLPIYGPYGYSTATDASSGIRRMTSGFVKRNGQTTDKTTGLPNTNLSAVGGVTGRTTLPIWAASVQGRSTTLTSAQYGPRSDATYANGPTTNLCPIGLFAEDYDYLGDLGYTQGVDFDLNRQNVRWCVTPEYPSGSYAYFVCIDASGNSVFPDIINQEFFATAAAGQGTVTSITETVTEYVKGGQASALTLAAATASGGSGVTLSWPSVEGATYTAASSHDGTTYTTLSSTLTASRGSVATYTTSTVAAHYKITLSALATYDTSGNGGVSGLNTFATTTYSLPNTAPTLDSVDNLNGSPEDTVSTIPYAAIAAAANEYDAEGDAISFRVESLGSGTLAKNGAAVAVGTLLSAGESFAWTPPADAYGDFVACTFVAYDGALASTPAANLTIHVEPVNDAPVLTTVATLAGAAEDEAFNVHFFTLENAADEADPDGPAKRFRVESVLSGTLTKDGVAVTPGATTLADGETLVWTPPANANGTLAAFTVVATDTLLASTPAVTVDVQVAAVADPAEWDGSAGTGDWSTAANWLENTVPGAGETIRFTGATPTGISLGADRTVKGLHFSGESPYTLSDHTLTLDAASLTTSSTTGTLHTIASAVQLTGKSVFLLQPSSHLRITGNVTGDEIEKFGPSDLTFNGTTNLTTLNAFDYGRVIFAGTANLGFLDLNDGATLQTSTAVTLNITELKLGGSGTGTLTLGGGADLVSEIIDLVADGSGQGIVNLTGVGTTATVTNGIYGTATDTLSVTFGARLSVPSLNTVTATLRNGTLALTGPSSSPLYVDSYSTIETTGESAALTGAITGPGHLTKTGPGTLTLGATHARTGDTYIDAGTLRLTSPALASDQRLYLRTSGTLQLDFTGTQNVRALVLGSTPQYAGTYGGLTSSADHKTAQITGPGLLSVTQSDLVFFQWAAIKGLDGSAGRESGELDDPDGDGAPNVLEYVLGGDPLASDPQTQPVTTIAGGYLTLAFNRTDVSENDQTVSVETSTDLATWTPHPLGATSSTSSGVIITVTENGTAADTITAQIPLTAPRTFARLKVANNEE